MTDDAWQKFAEQVITEFASSDEHISILFARLRSDDDYLLAHAFWQEHDLKTASRLLKGRLRELAD